MEASVVLSGTFMERHIVSRSLYVILEQMWLKESAFVRCPGLPAEASGGVCEAE